MESWFQNLLIVGAGLITWGEKTENYQHEKQRWQQVFLSSETLKLRRCGRKRRAWPHTFVCCPFEINAFLAVLTIVADEGQSRTAPSVNEHPASFVAYCRLNRTMDADFRARRKTPMQVYVQVVSFVCKKLRRITANYGPVFKVRFNRQYLGAGVQPRSTVQLFMPVSWVEKQPFSQFSRLWVSFGEKKPFVTSNASFWQERRVWAAKANQTVQWLLSACIPIRFCPEAPV